MENAVIANPDVFNKQLLEAIANITDENEFNKVASDVSSQAVRRRLRESGFMRRIQPMKPVNPNEFVRDDKEDNLYVVDEMEPDQPGAVSLPLNDTHRSHYFRGDAFRTTFFKIATPDWTKNIHELKVYKKIDLQKIIVDNSLKDIQTHEDSRYLGWVNEIVGAPGGANGLAGYQQNFDYATSPSVDGPTAPLAITRESYSKYTLSHLEDRELNNGVFLVNRKTFKEFLPWNRNEVGGDLAESLLTSGMSALKEAKIFGIPHIVTMKRELVADGEVYQFAEPDFLGKAYSIKDVTMYVKREKDLLRISAEEIIGVTIANLAAVNKVTFKV
jgi:hypothetical protein